MKDINTFFITCILTFIGLIYNALCWGLVMYNFWQWFILPVFPALPEVNYIHAIGLMVFISLFKETSGIKNYTEKEMTQQVIILIIMPWVVLLFGWLVWLIFLQ